MSDYCKEKVVRIKVSEKILKSLGLIDVWDLENKYPELFNPKDFNQKTDYFEIAPTEENFVDYILEYQYGACSGDYGFSRYLKEDEINLYLPKFKEIFPEVTDKDLRIVNFCWYNCTEAPDYFDVE